MKIDNSLYLVDSFTSEPFKGNPAGVCLMEEMREASEMLSIAAELGFSETAFVLKADAKGIYRIRYFSPKMEIPLCGHATLAAAKVLFSESQSLDKVQFQTIKNTLLVVEKDGEKIVMRFPLYQTQPTEAPATLLRALGITNALNCEYNSETNMLLVEIESSEVLRALAPDYSTLIESHSGIDGVLVTAKSSQEEFDFESRYFWPWSGTLEDPVTGATHTFLAPYWSKKLGKTTMKSFQCSKRTGSMTVSVVDGKELLIKGEAQIIFQGKLLV
ncbi:MAG: PhzF family phenazine biosynthesis protein [Cyclobacteriaceae bacterium]